MILIVASRRDVASLNIKGKILRHYCFTETPRNFEGTPIYSAEVNNRKAELVTLKAEPIYAQDIANSFPNSELIVFISRHSSISETPTLSVHTPGNLAEAELGGNPRRISVSPANAMRDVLKTMVDLKEAMQLNYEVSYECTHHGPSLNAPALFAELGSSPEQWSDLRAADAVAQAVMGAVSKFNDFPAETVLGIGGPHYNRKFTRMALDAEIAFGHIIPKHAVPFVNVKILSQCVERTLERVEFAVLDWKGIKGKHKLRLMEMLGEIGLPFQKA